MNFVKSNGSPIVFRKLKESALFYGGSLYVPLEPHRLRMGGDHQLYHPAPLGMGRIAPELLLEWEPYFDMDDEWWLKPAGPFSELKRPHKLEYLSDQEQQDYCLVVDLNQ